MKTEYEIVQNESTQECKTFFIKKVSQIKEQYVFNKRVVAWHPAKSTKRLFHFEDGSNFALL